MKGQIFIVGSVLVAIALFAISIGFTEIVEQENYLQRYFVNLRTELTNTVDNTLLVNGNVATELDNYILFSDQVLTEKGYDQEVFYTIVGNEVTIDIYLGRGEEYYKDTIIIDRIVFG